MGTYTRTRVDTRGWITRKNAPTCTHLKYVDFMQKVMYCIVWIIMLEKTVRVGEVDVKFRSLATIPRLYRIKFKRDIFKDLAKLESSFKVSKEGGEEFAIFDHEIFENVAYIMAYHADSTIPNDINDWLD